MQISVLKINWKVKTKIEFGEISLIEAESMFTFDKSENAN